MPILEMTVPDIEKLMRGKLVLCRKHAPRIVTCASTQCSFKDGELRSATARELCQCRKFNITAVNA